MLIGDGCTAESCSIGASFFANAALIRFHKEHKRGFESPLDSRHDDKTLVRVKGIAIRRPLQLPGKMIKAGSHNHVRKPERVNPMFLYCQ